METNREADLHILRQLKFVPSIMEICKRMGMVHKSQLDEWLRVVDSGLTLLVLIVQLQENRTYMLLTNRLVPLVELLLWCLNRPTKSVYSLSCVP